MPKLNQSGFAHILLIILLLAGLGVGVYLVQQKTNILPKADEPKSVCNQVPDMPLMLNGDCAPGSGTAELSWAGSTSCALETTYYVRYIKPDGTWWPKPNNTSQDSQSVTKIGYKTIEIGLGKSIKAWGVYACNTNGCSDFASSGGINCGDTNVVPAPTEIPLPSATPKPTIPPAPDMLTGICPVPGTKATLSWKLVPGATRYGYTTIDMTIENSKWASLTETTDTSVSYPTIPGHSYSWGVVSCIDPVGSGLYSAVCSTAKSVSLYCQREVGNFQLPSP